MPAGLSEAAPDRQPRPDEEPAAAALRSLVEREDRPHEESTRGLGVIADGSLHDPRALVVVDGSTATEKHSSRREIEAVFVPGEERGVERKRSRSCPPTFRPP